MELDAEEVNLVAEALSKAGWAMPHKTFPLKKPKETFAELKTILTALVEAKVTDELGKDMTSKPKTLDDKEAMYLFKKGLHETGIHYNVSIEHQAKSIEMVGMMGKYPADSMKVCMGPSLMTLSMSAMSKDMLRSFVNFLRKWDP